MATSPPALRAQLQAALQTLATGDPQASATQLLATLGYASPKTLALPHDPQAFAKAIENLTGGAKQLHAEHASLADWQSAAFLFQLTNDELPSLAAGQTSLMAPGGDIQPWQVESFVFGHRPPTRQLEPHPPGRAHARGQPLVSHARHSAVSPPA